MWTWSVRRVDGEVWLRPLVALPIVQSFVPCDSAQRACSPSISTIILDAIYDNNYRKSRSLHLSVQLKNIHPVVPAVWRKKKAELAYRHRLRRVHSTVFLPFSSAPARLYPEVSRGVPTDTGWAMRPGGTNFLSKFSLSRRDTSFRW
ncbi:hypothetical protein SCLCIDRAFT_980851 [Scleroderma citrinum Foug A]|uniref:Uncharacterized protein n=1 Tax=Scleroderma citrinum Foug A TaxID=1036808 RepID=A0A0C3DUC2_9AGAM|nr:hypothetical protein SCLCIDRAFT_980851 [Scleroderma citrinum Foug A]